jgi:hypothetical protein
MTRHAVPTGLVADGRNRLAVAPEYQASLQRLRQAILERYAKQLATAGWIERRFLYWRIGRAYRAALRRLSPSPYSLF